MEFYTIGVYNSSEEDYFNKLIENQIDTFCDIRLRRIVRGAKYAFVNSTKLQNKLNSLNIRYKHIIELAPTKEIRAIQKNLDLEEGVLKRNREHMSEAFITAYKERILNHFNFDSFIKNLTQEGAQRIVLFCVEEKKEACHRSIVAEKIKDYGFNVIHL